MAQAEYFTFDQAVEHVMRVTGKKRRQAKQALLQKLKSGEIRGVIGKDGKPIPPEFFQIIPSEH